MVKFAEGQRVRVPAGVSSAPKALRDQAGVIESIVISQVPYDCIAAQALEDGAEQKYDVKFDFDNKLRQCGESQLEAA